MNTMVTLINLKNDNGIIYTDYFIESNVSDLGHIEYDSKSKEVISYSYCKEDKNAYVKYGFSKALIAIEKLIEYNKFPEKYRYIWY